MSDESKVNREILTGVKVDGNLTVGDIIQKTTIDRALSPPKYIPTDSIPYPASTNFVGRDGVLKRLANFHTSQRIVAVVGMAGVGKTELAVQYAHKYGRNYGGGCYWLGMRDRVLADLLTQHVLREFKLDLPPEITDKREMAQWCWAQWERNLSTDSRVLLVLDNVDEVSQIGGMLPSDGRFRLLVTTRCQGLDATIVEEGVEELTDAAALEFLRKLIGGERVDKELEQAQRLCSDLLGNLPLGIELVGRYLHQDDLTIARFTADLSKVQEELDGKDPEAVYPTMIAQRGVKSALELVPWYVKRLEKAEQRLGANHPDTATSLNHLAGLYYSIGSYKAAEPLYIRALQIREQQLGANHPSTATSLNNLARLYESIGKYKAAEPLYVRALDLSEQQLGANHPDTATSLNHLAGWYDSIGSYKGAEPLYIRALQIREQQLGANHPSTATSLNNLARLYYSIDPRKPYSCIPERWKFANKL
jgi:tetratricopeptide (TPR) repeat protein